jgi:NAD(P)-dependent dehydrogenase (short-subunit alcohol dehydrogenase family)
MRTGRQLAIAIVSSTIGLATAAHAQVPAADTRPITLVVHVAAGGGMDTIGRAIAERLAERLKQTVVVENRVGAGGAVGVDYVAKAAPDGRTLLMDISAVLHKWLNKSILAAALSWRMRGGAASRDPAFQRTACRDWPWRENSSRTRSSKKWRLMPADYLHNHPQFADLIRSWQRRSRASAVER